MSLLIFKELQIAFFDKNINCCIDVFCLQKQSVNFVKKKKDLQIQDWVFDLMNKFIVPDVIANTPSHFLKVTYSNDEEVVPGSTLTYEEILGKESWYLKIIIE